MTAMRGHDETALWLRDILPREGRYHLGGPIGHLKSALATASKPSGLWWAPGTHWLDWMEQEAPEWIWRITHVWVVEPVDLLEVKTTDDLDAFDRRFRRPAEWGHRIDWAEVGRQYGAIEIAPYQWERRLSLNWYYTWDVASGCAWHPATRIDLVAQRNGCAD